MPKTAIVILALGLVWFVLRQIAARADARRRAAREERMDQLMREREDILVRQRETSAPNSMAGMVADIHPESPAVSQTTHVIKIRCRSCATLCDEREAACSSCGAAL